MKFKRFIIRGPEVKARAMNYLQHLEMSQDEPLEVIIQPFKDQGTAAQKRKYWACVGELSDFTGEDPEHLSNQMKAQYCSPEIVTVTDREGDTVQVEVLPSIANMEKEELSKLIGKIVQHAAELGIRFSYTVGEVENEC